jgi:PadR family transcriptional regulator AphA
MPTASDRPDSQPTGTELSVSDYVVLGMVRLGAQSGYEIKRKVELSIRFFWTISQAQIYPGLERLERARLVQGRSEPQGNRPRRVFAITTAGEAALREWLSRSEPMPFELRDVGLLKLFFADAQDPAAALALLASVQRRSEERVATLRAVEPAARLAEQEGNAYPVLTLELGIAYHQAMIDTCAEFRTRLPPTYPSDA